MSETIEDVLADFAAEIHKPQVGSYELRVVECMPKYAEELRGMLKGETCTMQPTFINPTLKDGGYYQEYECSNCNEYSEVTNYYGDHKRPNYCMHCGAKVIWDD